MWRIVGNIVEMFVYASVYLIVVLVATKIVGASFSADFEKKISEEGHLGHSLICAGICIGMAILLAAVIR
jgi:uncharacterized membrane protein YjfL (UPF0719 family)